VEIFIFVGFLALIVIGAIYAHRQAARRRNELTALAVRLGWTFRSENDRTLAEQLGAPRCLQQGSNRYAYNVLEGRYHERTIRAFDYHYETYSTDSKGNRQTNHHRFSVAVLETGLPLKPLLIRPEGFFDRIGEFFGMDDIDFESNQFSREFHVTSPDRRWAFDVIHQATMEFLLEAPRFTVELHGPRVLVYRGGHFQPAEFETAIRLANGIIDRLPNYLLTEWKGAAR
jgi:hypothetical protein